MADYYTLAPEAVLEALASRRGGLSPKEAEDRLTQYGPNTIRLEKKIDVLELFIRQFTGLLVLVLIGAGILSYAVGDPIDTVAIFAIVLLNGLLGFFQEYKAERAIEALKKLGALHATVRRGGEWIETDAQALVPGDIVQLEEGVKIPADIRFIETIETSVDEALLTGESNPVNKQIEAIEGNPGVADRVNYGYANTSIVRGRGVGIVIATGLQTEFGKIAQKLEDVEDEPTPLKQHLDVFAKQMTIGVVLVMVALFVLGYFIQGRELVEMLLLAIALGVAAIPEGLPAITTITLALGVQRIAQKNALIKHLPSAETLGATTVICSDKTGTLTKNEMTVEYVYADEKLYHVSGVGYSPRGNVEWNNAPFTPENGSGLEKAIQCGVHSNNAQYSPREATILGDPTEGAMVVLGHKTGIVTQWERVKEIPFTSARKQMTTIHAVGGKAYRIFSKGAVERILDGCSFVLENGKKIPLTQGKKQQIQTQTNTLAASAYRVLGCAYLDTETIPTNPETNLVFVGLLALRDPPREEAKGAIATCVGAGIQVKMITGDHPLTAKAIAERLGLEGEVITGEQINGMSDAELNEVVRTHAIFARVDPEHKYRIVERLQQSGHVVAVTGDGVNDAPAIKKADIGIAMGIKGTDVAKEASDMVLRDDNFATIVNAVELGRTIYANLQGFVRYLLGANLAEILVVATGFFLAAGEVLTPIQLLWINLVTDAFPALALGEDPPTKDVMRKKPRPKSAGILDQMGSFIVVSGLIGSIVTLFAFFHGLRMGETYAGTMAFTMIVVFELVLVFNAREEGKTMLEHSPFTNLWLILAVGLSLGLQLMAIYVPWLAPFFGTVPLSGEDWVLIGGLSLFALLVPKISHFWNTHRGAHLVEGVSPSLG